MKLIKITLAILLLLCLSPMPYGFYNLVRIIVIIIMTIFAYSYYKKNKIELCITFVGLVVLFQPIVKIPLEKEIWNIVDILVAGLLLYLTITENKK